MDEHLALLSLDWQVEHEMLVDGIVIEEIVRVVLVRPDGFARVRPPSEERARPFVVAGAKLRIPGTRVRSAVEDQIQLGIVRNPAPRTGAADLPHVWRPRRDAEIFSAIRLV